MHFVHFPSKIAGNKLQFPAHKQQLLEFVVAGGDLFDVIVVADVAELIQKVIHMTLQN